MLKSYAENWKALNKNLITFSYNNNIQNVIWKITSNYIALILSVHYWIDLLVLDYMQNKHPKIWVLSSREGGSRVIIAKTWKSGVSCHAANCLFPWSVKCVRHSLSVKALSDQFKLKHQDNNRKWRGKYKEALSIFIKQIKILCNNSS